MDAVVSRVCRTVAEELGPGAKGELSASAIIALGGYGRQELAPSSGLHLLFLHGGELGPLGARFVERVLPALRALGLGPRHCVRSVMESVRVAEGDLHARNASSDARLLLGNRDLYQKLQRQLLAKVFGNPVTNRRFFIGMKEEFLERREKHGPGVVVPEPNVKEGPGGLRDVHTVTWVGLAHSGARGLDGLLSIGLVSPEDYAQVLGAYDFLLRVRNEAHFRTGRGTDVLSVDLQTTLASGLGYSPDGPASAHEIFMRAYYSRAQEIQRFTDVFLRRVELARSS